MTFGQRLLVAFIVLGLIALVMRLVSRRQLSVNQALIWITLLLGSEVLLLVPGVLAFVTRLTGAVLPVSALTLLALITLTLLFLQLSVAVSRMRERQRELARSMALIERRLRRSTGRPKMNRRERST